MDIKNFKTAKRMARRKSCAPVKTEYVNALLSGSPFIDAMIFLRVVWFAVRGFQGVQMAPRVLGLKAGRTA